MLFTGLLVISLFHGAVLGGRSNVPESTEFPALQIDADDVRYRYLVTTTVSYDRKTTNAPEKIETPLPKIRGGPRSRDDAELGAKRERQPRTDVPPKKGRSRNYQKNDSAKSRSERRASKEFYNKKGVEDQAKVSGLRYEGTSSGELPKMSDVKEILRQHFSAGDLVSSTESPLKSNSLEDAVVEEITDDEVDTPVHLLRERMARQISDSEARLTTPRPSARLHTGELNSDVPLFGPRPPLQGTGQFEADAEWVPEEELQAHIFKENTPTDPLYKAFLPQNLRNYTDRQIQAHLTRAVGAPELPPDYGLQRPRLNLYDRHDLHQMRQAGPLCGVFLHPLFHAELRAVNQSSYVLRNVYVNTKLQFSSLTIAYTGEFKTTSQLLPIDPAKRPRLHDVEFLLDARRDIRDVREVVIFDDLKRFSVHLDVSRCLVPTPWATPGLKQQKKGVLSDYVILHTSNVFVIGGFTYPESCPEARFWTGRTNNPSNGFVIPTLDGGEGPLRTYQKEDVWLQLPRAATFYDLDYLGVFCPEPRDMLGFIYLPHSNWEALVLPPAILSEDRLKIKHESSLR